MIEKQYKHYLINCNSIKQIEILAYMLYIEDRKSENAFSYTEFLSMKEDSLSYRYYMSKIKKDIRLKKLNEIFYE